MVLLLHKKTRLISQKEVQLLTQYFQPFDNNFIVQSLFLDGFDLHVSKFYWFSNRTWPILLTFVHNCAIFPNFLTFRQIDNGLHTVIHEHLQKVVSGFCHWTLGGNFPVTTYPTSIYVINIFNGFSQYHTIFVIWDNWTISEKNDLVIFPFVLISN